MFIDVYPTYICPLKVRIFQLAMSKIAISFIDIYIHPLYIHCILATCYTAMENHHVQSTNLDGSCCKAMQQDSRRYHSILYGYMLYVEYSVYI